MPAKEAGQLQCSGSPAPAPHAPQGGPKSGASQQHSVPVTINIPSQCHLRKVRQDGEAK